MQAIMDNTRGLTLLVNLNWDRILYALTLMVALCAGAWLGTVSLS